ncbi:MAG TPA: hypothetical protein VF547_01320 [Allosphingosinicella sp.]|jgi:hypothetical protein
MTGRLSASSVGAAAALAVAAAALVLPSQPAKAQLDPNGTGNCRVGGTVSLRDGRVGTVVRAQGNSCHVRLADGSEQYALQWMLTPVRGGKGAPASGAGGKGAPAGGGKLVPGNYQCYGGAAGNMRVRLTGPRYNGAYAVPLPDGRVGLSYRPGGPFYMTCERR